MPPTLIMQPFLHLLTLTILSLAASQTLQQNYNTGLVLEKDDLLLILSTLSGSLIGVGQSTGEVYWTQDDEPVVKVPLELPQSSMPMFLPDPKDGSLYLFGTEAEAFKKLPFTIPQLVANSPCRSSDGILYTGRKIDTWFGIDPSTGDREQLFGFEEVKNTCPLKTQNTIFVGRTEYNIIMVDSKQKDRKWNVTFYDYSAVKMEPDRMDNYELVHFAASSTGRVVTLNRRLGTILWELDVGSPVIAAYIVSKDGLMSVPFTSVADTTMDLLLKQFTAAPVDVQLFPTLYIGQHRHGLYALPSLVDSTTAITNSAEHLMLEGPRVVSQRQKSSATDLPLSRNHTPVNDYNEPTRNHSNRRESVTKTDASVVSLGYYKIPAEFKMANQPLQITGRTDSVIHNEPPLNATKKSAILVRSDASSNITLEQKNWQLSVSAAYAASKAWLNQQENKGLKLALIILVGCVVTMFWYLNAQFKEFQQLSQGSRENSRTSNSTRSDNFVYVPEDIGEGLVKVGKITFNTAEVLGKGCDGTFVYKGEFDGRPVAVKRLLPECFTFADREVTLLRESDAHANVVRYFCTEQDRMFKYIALELAEATLQDYVAGRYNRGKISAKDILRQATLGLAHLHLLDIVHRDIKPHNVLLSVPGARGEVRAMISDFGLCKKLQVGRVSFSRRSGVTGTDGWIAPEMLSGERTTCAVDVFSLGCVFYYVLSDGKHPYGDPLRRQANILCGESNLTGLQGMSQSDRELALHLVRGMIANEPSARPPAAAVHDHPFFWKPSEVLAFLQDVSDRVEKDELDSPALIALETFSGKVTLGDWRSHIDHQVASDLRRYRSYRGESVRDLLRALRNKKHHYRELTAEAQESLGEIPDKFAEYWLSRFPRLLPHVWCAMQEFRKEPTLRHYYHAHYKFTSEADRDERAEPESSRESYTMVAARAPKVRNAVDWSPNRTRYRVQRKRPEKRKTVDVPLSWTLSSTN